MYHKIKSKVYNVLSVLAVSLVVFSSTIVFLTDVSLVFAHEAFVQSGVSSTNVMAPLFMDSEEKRNEFRRQLKIAKDIRINAVTVDVWWGLVEKAEDNKFDWSYYKSIVKDIEAAGLHWVPIMSFHMCGGNVGDECNIPIPAWIWTRYQDQGITERDLQYKSEKDNFNGETISLWQDHIVKQQYIDFMNDFEKEFGSTAGIIDEINISLGPAGELRYPSYNAHDFGCGFPTRGCFQAYSDIARQDFRNFVLKKYNNLNGVNAAWGTSLTVESQIGPPDDENPSNGRANHFVVSSDHFDTQYGRDFIDWYNHALVEHGRRMLEAAISAFDGAFVNEEIGMKMAGVHWQMSVNASQPRIAETTAGLIQTSIDFSSRSTGYGYEKIMNMVASFNNVRKIAFHFTCLEKDNLEWDGSFHAFSLAKDLVFFVAQAAEDRGVTIKGENALPEGVVNHNGWNNIENAFKFAAYSGFTALRINNITDNNIGRDRYHSFIQRFKK